MIAVSSLRIVEYSEHSVIVAPTGLSYLALLTTLGAVFVGRAIAAGLGPFSVRLES